MRANAADVTESAAAALEKWRITLPFTSTNSSRTLSFGSSAALSQ
jgi:hypothetical protein